MEYQCFVKCYLEKTGILNGDGYLIRERAIQLNWATSEETLDECETQSRSEYSTKSAIIATY